MTAYCRRKEHLTTRHGNVVHQVHPRVEVAFSVHGVLLIQPQQRSASQSHLQVERCLPRRDMYLVLYVPRQLVGGGDVVVRTRPQRRGVVKRAREVVHLPSAEVLIVFPLHPDGGFVVYHPCMEHEVRFRTHEHIQRFSVHCVVCHILIGQQHHVLRPLGEGSECGLNGRSQLGKLRLPNAVKRVAEIGGQRKRPPRLRFIIDIECVTPC